MRTNLLQKNLARPMTRFWVFRNKRIYSNRHNLQQPDSQMLSFLKFQIHKIKLNASSLNQVRPSDRSGTRP